MNLQRKSFWNNLPKPFFCLAPMADVTDVAYRRIIAKYGKPDVMWTEFVSADGLFRVKGGPARPGEVGLGYDALIKDLEYSESERPIVAQFFSNTPSIMARAAKLAEDLGFDGVDINAGCPDKSVCKQGSGAALIQTPELTLELIQEMKRASTLPVSVKTRIGYNRNEIETWIPTLLSAKPTAIVIHGRTKKEMSKVPAHWEAIKRAVQIRDELLSDTLIIGNGDVETLEDAQHKVRESGVDGVMFGRAIFGNPWLLSNSHELDNNQGEASPRPNLRERLKVLEGHVKLFDELLACPSNPMAKKEGCKSFSVMKKHFKSYMRGEDKDKELLSQLMETKNASEAIDIIRNRLTT